MLADRYLNRACKRTCKSIHRPFPDIGLFWFCVKMFTYLVLAFAVFYVSSAQVDKSKAVGPCIDGLCPPRHFCANTDNECYPREKRRMASMHSHKAQRDAATEGAVSIGSCVNGLCPNGFDCVNNICFKTAKSTGPAPSSASGGTLSIGPCVNAKCPDGFSCNKAEYKCYAN